jgi:hypothetical protein
MKIKDSVKLILSDKKARQTGLHVKHIARHILNMNNNLFSDGENLNFESVKVKVNRILLYDVRKKRGSLFVRVINPKTKKFRKGVYKLK